MSDSPLVNYTHISPYCTKSRTHKIDTITIHCAAGHCSVGGFAATFTNPNRQVSANYGIADDGRIGLYVHEKDRSWCSSNSENDDRAITIECASDSKDPCAINDKVYNSLIKLCADICKRNGIKELKWKADKSLIGQVDKQNMTVHRWFANKSCPGDYIYNRLGKIASEVNSMLNASQNTKETYRVQIGVYKNKNSAIELFKKAKSLGYDAYVVKVGSLYKIQVGKFNNKNEANKLATKLDKVGFNTFLTTSTGIVVNIESKKSIDEIAREVIKGLWGSGQARKDKLTKAGYDYSAVQKRVNELV